MSQFLTDIQELRQKARTGIEAGALTWRYRGDLDQLLQMLDSALATEWLCVLRYTQHAIVARGIHAEAVGKHFAAHAAQEQDHALRIATRMRQLGGDVSLSPESLSGRAHSEYKEAPRLIDMIKENLVAERIAIDSYSEMIRVIGDKDPTSRRMLEEILAVEEEHADEMADLLIATDLRSQMSGDITH